VAPVDGAGTDALPCALVAATFSSALVISMSVMPSTSSSSLFLPKPNRAAVTKNETAAATAMPRITPG